MPRERFFQLAHFTPQLPNFVLQLLDFYLQSNEPYFRNIRLN